MPSAILRIGSERQMSSDMWELGISPENLNAKGKALFVKDDCKVQYLSC